MASKCFPMQLGAEIPGCEFCLFQELLSVLVAESEEIPLMSLLCCTASTGLLNTCLEHNYLIPFMSGSQHVQYDGNAAGS